MFYIIKGREPASLTEYKKQKGAYYDGFPNMDEIRQLLLEEQGYLCAYCMRRINNVSEATIEHYYPQSKINDSESLNYKHMLGVCKLNRECSEKYQTCDAHRDNEHLTVNPWDAASISLIEYNTGSGIIFSRNQDIDKDLNVTLNLNCTEAKLPQGRKDALVAMKSFIYKKHKQGTWNKAVLNKIKENYASKDENGKYKPYVGILLWWLNKRIKAN